MEYFTSFLSVFGLAEAPVSSNPVEAKKEFKQLLTPIVLNLQALEEVAEALTEWGSERAGHFSDSVVRFGEQLDTLGNDLDTRPIACTKALRTVRDNVETVKTEATLALAAQKTAVRKLASDAIKRLEVPAVAGWLDDGKLDELRNKLTEGDNNAGQAYTLWTALPGQCTAATTSVKKTNYDLAKTAQDDALKLLKSHLQAAHVATEINTANTALLAAVTHAGKGEATEANTKVTEADTAIKAGKRDADKFAAYRVKRAAAAAVVQSLKGLLEDTELNVRKGQVTAADNLAKSPTRNYVLATSQVETILTDTAAEIRQAFHTGAIGRITTLSNHEAKDFVNSDIVEIGKLHTKVDTELKAANWRLAIVNGRRLFGQLVWAERIALRRAPYDVARKNTVGLIDALKLDVVVATKAEAIELGLAPADLLASRAKARFEQATAELGKLDVECAKLTQLAIDLKAYATEKSTLEEKITTLTEHDSSEDVAGPLEAIRRLLEEAENLKGADDPGAGRKILARAIADADSAIALADGVGDAVSLRTDAAEAGQDGEKILIAVEKVRQQAAIAKQRPHADVTDFEYTHVEGSLDEAESKARDGHLGLAEMLLQNSIELLVRAQFHQSEHARFLVVRALVDNRRKALLLRTSAVPNEAKITKIRQTLEAADKADVEGAWTVAFTKIREGEVAATEAEAAADAREAFNTRHKDLSDLRDTVTTELSTDATRRNAIRDALALGVTEADKFDFAKAAAALDLAEATIEAVKVKKAATAGSSTGGILASAKKMMQRANGAQQLDELVHALPDTTPFAVIAALAKERFNVEFTSDLGEETKSAQRIWDMMAQVPDTHTRNNPSLARVQRKGPTQSGGAYNAESRLIVMNGRPTDGKNQAFGSNLVSAYDGTPQLTNVEEAYQPDNDDAVSYFDFATLHEVGHAVDDRLNFMGSRAENADFGGWKVWSGSLEPIAQAVADKFGYDKDYVLAKMTGKDPEPAAKSDLVDEGVWTAAQAKVDEWAGLATGLNAWWNQGKTDKLTIDGVVYQEAYAANWVSYPASARRKGLTGYQFRAPGEWFAEVYAAYHIGKLKDGHPYETWLEDLK